MAAPVGPKKVKRYSDEFKLQAVKLANHPDIQAQDVAHALDIHPFMLSKWKKDFREGRLKPAANAAGLSLPKVLRPLKRQVKTLQEKVDARAEARRLERKLAALQVEHDLLKKAIPLQYRTPKAKFEFIAEHRAQHGVAFLCRRYRVSRSGFYAWLARVGSQRRRNDEERGVRIERIYRDSGGRYGSPRVHKVLRREGICCSNKRVARLMRERGLRARVTRLYRKGSGMVRRFFAKTGNLRLEQPGPTRTDQIWVGDLTYLRLGKRWRYLATVMDLFSRRIVGWTLARHRTIDVTLRALKRAIAARSPKPGLLLHSDRGIEYSAYGYQDFLKANGILPSMNRPRHCQDNAHMESFFHSLKAELTHQRSYASDAELNASIAGYIDRFYNQKRIHSSLGYHSPVEYERLVNA